MKLIFKKFKERKTLLGVLMLVAILSVESCSNSSESVKIGKQVWMSQNLNVSTFKNGDPIPEAKTDGDWQKAGIKQEPAWCYYDNDAKNGEKYGKLYNWYALNDQRGIAPTGWHIPSEEEWNQLTNFLGNGDVPYAGNKLINKKYWSQKCDGDESGFSGLPGGCREGFGKFKSLGNYAHWWTSKELNASAAWGRTLFWFSDKFIVNRDDNGKAFGNSIRCIKDDIEVSKSSTIKSTNANEKSVTYHYNEEGSKIVGFLDKNQGIGYYQITLQSPITISPMANISEADADPTEDDVKVIQLAFDQTKIDISKYMNCKVEMTGSFFHADGSPNHYLPVLMMVKEINKI